jgi:L-lactate dehydrogenase complex protein LldE
MTIGLFIPCYVHQFYPQVAIATLELLEKQGLNVKYPLQQTCCGQPMANSGFETAALETYKLFVENFQSFDYVVAPSGSCVHHVRDHFDVVGQTEEVKHIRTRTFELCEFLVKVLGKDKFNAEFPFRVGLHQSCHGLRGLHLGKPSETMGPGFSITHHLLANVKGLELVELDRTDECCGFGGTFAVAEEAVSVKMGNDRIQDHSKQGAEVITATDMSCLMHLEGLIRRQNIPITVKHIAEILNSTAATK